MEDRASDVLEQSGAVDVDERTESWRQSGWTGYQAGTGPADVVHRARGRRHHGRLRDGSTRTAALGTTGTAATGWALTGTRQPELREGEEAIPVVEEQVRVGSARSAAAACGSAATSSSARSRSR